MALGGATIAAAILASGFEPLVKLPLGLVLRRSEMFKLGLIPALPGYATLMAGSAAAYLRAAGVRGC